MFFEKQNKSGGTYKLPQNDTERLKIKGWEKISQVVSQRKLVAVFIADKNRI